MPFAVTRTDLENIILSERERQISCDITYMWNLKYDTNELTCETDSQTENRLVVAKGGGQVWSRSFGLTDTNYYMQNG